MKLSENSIRELLIKGYEILRSAEIVSYQLDCQLLLSKIIKKSKLYIITNKDVLVDKDKAAAFYELIELRRNRMPVKYILQECEFMGINMFIEKGVLIPRPDTEILVEQAIKDIISKGYKYICDVCSGSGAIGIAVAAHIEGVIVECYDISKEAKVVNEININRLELGERVRFFQSDLLSEALLNHKTFDVILSNPPYIKAAVIPTLIEDVKDYEPFMALCGGEDGLDFYRQITWQSIKCLNSKGMLCFEIGYDQKLQVENILNGYGFTDINCINDLEGNNRVITAIMQ